MPAHAQDTCMHACMQHSQIEQHAYALASAVSILLKQFQFCISHPYGVGFEYGARTQAPFWQQAGGAPGEPTEPISGGLRRRCHRERDHLAFDDSIISQVRYEAK